MVDKQNSSPVQSESESPLNDSPLQQEASAVNVVARESLTDWGVVVCVFLSFLISGIDFSGFAVFYPYLVEHFDATTAAVGWCSSANGFFQSLVALFASYPIQFYGCRLPGVVGCLLFSLGVTLSCLAPSLTVIYFTYGIIAAFLSIVAIYIDPGIIGTMASTALFGMHLGCTIPMVSVVTVELMGVALLPKSLAMLQFTGGFAELAASPLIGWVFDVTRDYNKAFAIIGCMAFVSSSLMFALTVAIRCQSKNSDATDIALSTSVNVVSNPPIDNSSQQ